MSLKVLKPMVYLDKISERILSHLFMKSTWKFKETAGNTLHTTACKSTKLV